MRSVQEKESQTKDHKNSQIFLLNPEYSQCLLLHGLNR